MIKFLQVFCILTVQVILSFAWNYCQPKLKLCHGDKHFMCDLTELEPVGGTTEFVGHVLETDSLKAELLKFHNQKRSYLAGGFISGLDGKAMFPTASRMREIFWDNELAYMARIYTSRVTTTRPKCFNTHRFKSCGHVVGFLVVGDDSALQAINQNILHSFWLEHTNISDPISFVENYNSNDYKNVDNFALLASDKITKVGCAISMGVNCMKSNPQLGCYFLSCFYDVSSKDSTNIYKVGKPEYDCFDWGIEDTSHYEYLC